jgi:putative transposase
MRPSRFTDKEILGALAEVRDGMPAVKVCRRMGITETTFYRWRNTHELPGEADAREVRELRDENQRLRQIVANLLLDQQRSLETHRKKPAQ